MHSPAQVTLNCLSVSLVRAIETTPVGLAFENAIMAAKAGRFRNGAPKVVVAVYPEGVKIAVGFPTDHHDDIAIHAFGSDWQKNCKAYGGGDLKIDFGQGSVEIVGMSTKLEAPVPREAVSIVVTEIKKLIMNG